MGADLIGFHLVGPVKVDRKLKKRAIQQVNGMSRATIELFDRHSPSYEDPTSEELERLIKGRYFQHLRGFQEWVYFDDVRFIKDTKKFVEGFMDFWDSPSFRDSTYRTYGKGKSQVKIVFAGEMSWGDEPQGLGYEILRMAGMSGLLDIFGIT